MNTLHSILLIKRLTHPTRTSPRRRAARSSALRVCCSFLPFGKRRSPGRAQHTPTPPPRATHSCEGGQPAAGLEEEAEEGRQRSRRFGPLAASVSGGPWAQVEALAGRIV